MDLYANYLESRMADELKVMESLTQRGINVIVTSGALVTIFVALSALVTGQDTHALAFTALPTALACVASLLFLVAALFGLAVTLTIPRDPHDRQAIRCMAPPATHEDAAQWIVEQRRAVLEDWFPKNTTKAGLLDVALVSEALAVAFLAACLIAALLMP